MPRKRTAGKPPHTRKRGEADILEQLRGALSKEEIERVLAGALLVLDKTGRDRLVARLGKATGGTLRSLLKAPGGGEPRPGKAKILQEWERAWEMWWEHVFESGDEEGRYVNQEYHWEPPYHDTGAVLGDLESPAAKMRPLIARVVEEDLDPDFSFAETIAQTDDEIGSGLPEWLTVDDSHAFGPVATSCLIEWEWRTVTREGIGPFTLLDNIRRLEDSLKRTYLDQAPIVTWALELGTKEQKEVLTGLEEHRGKAHWAKELESPRSGWFQIHKALAERWDPALFAETCHANIAVDWTLALPLLKDLTKRKAFAEARPIIEEAVRALLRLDQGERWNPRQGLLIQHPSLRFVQGQVSSHVELLRFWQRISAGTDDAELAAVLGLQVTVTRHWEDWDKTIKAFHTLEQSRVPIAVRDRLLEDWRLRVVNDSLSLPADGGSESLASRWLHKLVDFAIEGNDGEAFAEAVRSWLAELSERRTVDDCCSSLSTLTLDVDQSSVLKKTAPRFRQLLVRYANERGRLALSRRQWIKRLKGPLLLPDILEFWKDHAISLVPDPARAHRSRYYHQAEWMAAIRELDRKSYADIIEQWSVVHRRRRNLWNALKEAGLPTGEELRRERVAQREPTAQTQRRETNLSRRRRKG